MSVAPSLSRLHSPLLLCCPLKLSSSLPVSSVSHQPSRNQRFPASCRCIGAELDPNTAKRENTQPCFPCNGSGAQRCRFCLGTGTVTVELGGGEEEFSRCINREGVGTLTCTACLKAPGNSLDISTAGNDFILSDP